MLQHEVSRVNFAFSMRYQIINTIIVVLLGAVLTWIGWYLTEKIVQVPYMDEIFHVPQAIAYGQGRFEHWDSKLTTPPGLYLFSLPFLKSGIASDLLILRWVNVFFGLSTFLTVASIIAKQERMFSKHTTTIITTTTTTIWSALNVLLFPVSFFFMFLYYTDSGSTFFVLLAYRMALNGATGWTLLASLAAILFRQTNAIWMLFNAGVCLIMNLSRGDERRQDLLVSVKQSSNSISVISSFIACCCLEKPFVTLKTIVPFALVLAGCFVYVRVFNDGSIVFGDKSNHISALNIPQLYYFVSFCVFFLSPWLLLHGSLVIKRLSVVKWILALPWMVLSVHHYTWEHPFLLSDNRHFTFYIWRWIFRRHWAVRYAIVPLYAFFGAVLERTVKISCDVPLLFVAGLAVCSILALVPSPLLEFRYFIVPFILLRLLLGLLRARNLRATYTSLFLETIFFSAINVFVLYTFAYKPFKWPNEPDALQRFMW